MSFANSGTQTIDFQVRSGNVTFAYLNPTAHHSWGSGGTNYVGPQAGDSATSATLNLTNMFNNPMMGHHLVIGNTAGKTGTLNIHSSGHWKGYASSDVFVGQAGAGNLNISTIGIAQNSILEARDVRIGQFGGTGTATVSGWNALMKVNDSLVLGTFENSVGKLVVSNQGLVTVGNALVVGFGSFGDNMITVTGSGSKMTLGAGNVVLGSQGKGTLRVQNGGLVVNTGGEVRLAAINNGNSIGSLEIDGSGSHFNSTSSGAMSVGHQGTGSVSISSGGKMDVHSLMVGAAIGSKGTLTADGDGSTVNLNSTSESFVGQFGEGSVTLTNGAQLNTNGTFSVGAAAKGTLNVLSGSEFQGKNVFVGGSAAGSKLTVSGANTLIDVQSLDVGWGSNTEMLVSSGATVFSTSGRVGVVSGGQAVADIDGPASTWHIWGGGNFVVGQSGTGIVNATNGGDVVTKHAVFGSMAEGIGMANVVGSGSTWTSLQDTSLGDAGSGKMTVSDGAILVVGQDANFRLGNSAGGVGELTLNGLGSKAILDANAQLVVGRLGTGNLDVRNGAMISGGSGTIGEGFNATGVATVRNANSHWNAVGDIEVGVLGNGSLSVLSGGAVSANNLQIGVDEMASGFVVISGQNSKLSTTNQLVIGGNGALDGGQGALAIGSGATADVGTQLTLWSQGQLNLNGGKLVLSSLNVQGGQFNWNQGTVEFRQHTVLNEVLLDGLLGTSHSLGNQQTLTTGPTGGFDVAPGFLTVDGGKVTGNHFANYGTTAVLKGSMQMDGDFLNDVQGTFVVGNTGHVSFQGTGQNNGNWVMGGPAAKSSGGALTNHGTLSGSGQLGHQVINHGTIQLNPGDNLTIASYALSSNHGHIQLANGRLNVTGVLANEIDGLITGHGVLAISTAIPGGHGLFNTGTIAVGGSNLNIHGDVRNAGQGRIITSGNATTSFWDDVEHNGLEIRTSAGSSTIFFGSVTGGGPFTGTGAVYFEGDLKPGNSPANVLIEGNLYFGATASLYVELGGLAAGAKYDRLTVLGDIQLNGDLYVELMGGFRPAKGDTFLLIDNRGSQPLFGQFDGLDQGSIWTNGGQKFLVNYAGGPNGRGFSLTAVPEPSTALAMALVVLAGCLIRRQR